MLDQMGYVDIGSYLLIKLTIVAVTKCQLPRSCYNVSIEIGIMNMDITLIKVMLCLPGPDHVVN